MLCPVRVRLRLKQADERSSQTAESWINIWLESIYLLRNIITGTTFATPTLKVCGIRDGLILGANRLCATEISKGYNSGIVCLMNYLNLT
jgi:hypothetical protein